MWQRRIALLHIQDSDFTRPFWIVYNPALYNLSGSVGSFPWHSSAAMLVGAMLHDFLKYQDKCVMNALIRKEAWYCDDTFLFLNAIVDLSDVVCMGYPALCDQDFLQLLCVFIDVQQNPSD